MGVGHGAQECIPQGIEESMVEKIRRNKAGRWSNIAGILALVWMCIIFAFSAQGEEASGEVSEGVSYRIVNTTGLFFHLHLDEEQIHAIALVIEGTVRKCAHMAEFAILTVLLYVWMGRWEITHIRRGCYAVVMTMLYACTDEFHQLFVPGRAGRITDVMIDSAGAATGMVLCLLAEHIVGVLVRRRRAKKAARSDGRQ